MNKNIKAGADIHAGDGGYRLGTQEEYEAFVKGRNRSLAKSKIQELMYEAGYAAPELAGRANKLAELIVRECIHAIENTNDRYRRDYFANKIREHFGVEQ